jgi:beta-glucosidase
MPVTESPEPFIYRDATQPIDKRIEDLLNRMTLEEKIGQLNMTLTLPDEMATYMSPAPPSNRSQIEAFVKGSFHPPIGPAGGLFGVSGGFFGMHSAVDDTSPEEIARFFNNLQQLATATRLGIPLLQINEGVHGIMTSGATIFPEGPALGSTWNPVLIRDIYAAVMREARAIGVHVVCTLAIEPNRDPRMGRNVQTYSEDSFLCARFAEAIVEGVQGDRNLEELQHKDKGIALLTVFPGQTQASAGLERSELEISERTLRRVFLPPFQSAFAKGALGVMASYASIDGAPTHGSRWLLTELLREEMNFQGVVFSEGQGFETLVYEHVAADQAEAGRLGLAAGVDVNITFEHAFLRPLLDGLREGIVAESLLDQAVRRVLRLKFLLGLFEQAQVDPELVVSRVHTPEHQALAIQAAREGCVLLKNEGELLPLPKTLSRVAVIGPLADDARSQLGDYTVAQPSQPIITILKGIREQLGAEATVQYAQGCGVLGTNRAGFDAAIQAAREAEVAIVVLGEQQGSFLADNPELRSTVGEQFDAATLELTGVQQELLEAIYSTGTPTILVLVSGRPLAIRWAAEHIPALLMAWMCGERGGEAVAEILFGVVNPSGRLPITVPRHAGQLPIYYNHLPGREYWLGQSSGYVDLPATPLFPFGFGLSYTHFGYSKLSVHSTQVAYGEPIQLSVEVQNIGLRPGFETIQLYTRDVLASVTVPVRELRGFKKVWLEPGETTVVSFTLTAADLELIDRQGHRVLEPGEFEVMIGSSCEAIHTRAMVRVNAPDDQGSKLLQKEQLEKGL